MFWNAQYSGSFKAERSWARKDAMPCPRALRQSSCFPAWTDILRFQQAESSWSENPHRHWHWVRFCFFFFSAFLMQAVAKNCRAPKIHMRDICSSTAGDAELFQVNSTSWGTSDQKKIPIWTLPRKWQHWSSVQIQQLLAFIWKQLLTQHWHSSRIST